MGHGLAPSLCLIAGIGHWRSASLHRLVPTSETSKAFETSCVMHNIRSRNGADKTGPE
jgi:hypothetical protein